MSHFITNILKFNARQLLGKKAKRKKSSLNGFLNSENSQTPVQTDAMNQNQIGPDFIISNHHLITYNSNNYSHRNSPKPDSNKIFNTEKVVSNSNNHKEHINCIFVLNDPFNIEHLPNLGENLLIGYKKMGKMISIDKNGNALVKFDTSGKFIGINKI
jgi:hypothetical protein